MTEQFIIKAISNLIESYFLWEEMDKAIYTLGGELSETKFAEILSFHIDLVWDLIVEYRGYEQLSIGEFEWFSDILYTFVTDKSYSTIIEIEEEDGVHTLPIVLKNSEDILKCFSTPNYIESLLEW